jgi:hypothetical protein
MVERGFPEPTLATRMGRQVPDRYRTKSMNAVLIDFGPSTMAEASRYGFGGSTFPIDAGGDGVVVSRNPAFDAAAEECNRQLKQQFPGFSRLQGRSARFSSAVRTTFVDRLTPLVARPLLDRLACVRDAGYPALDPDQALESDDIGDILRLAGVQPGHEVVGPAPPDRSDVELGDQEAFPPQPPRRYEVSEEELAFSQTYVLCGQETSFVTRVRSAVRAARDRTAPRYKVRARKLAMHLRELAHAIARSNDVAR